MFKALVHLLLSAFILCVNGADYGGGGGGISIKSAGGAGGYGGGSGSTFGSGGALLLGGRSGGDFTGAIIPAAIQTIHNIEYRDVPTTRDIKTATIEVAASSIPLSIIFKSASSTLNVLQQHEGASGDTQETSSEDEPHILKHSVTKPIYQEVRELIIPSRKIIQEIQPVEEQIQTIVARGTGEPAQVVGGQDFGPFKQDFGIAKQNGGAFLAKPVELKSIAEGSKGGLGLGLVGKVAKELEQGITELAGKSGGAGGYRAKAKARARA